MDFHQWVADEMRVGRKAGKTLNFAMAFGAGKGTVTKNLAGDPDIIEEVGKEVEAMILSGETNKDNANRIYMDLCSKRAASMYHKYHERFPLLKRTSDLAAKVCKQRGYVFNAYGRRRYLPKRAARKAFNSIVQGCASDLMKERMVEVAPRYNKRTRDLGIHLLINVHDEVTFEVPQDILYSKEYYDWMKEQLQSPSVEFKVPIITGLGISPNNWAESGGDDKVYDGDKFVSGPVY
jgi:DNA polymerase I-like protein with 3'-5' exonuclease and polymerase domains